MAATQTAILGAGVMGETLLSGLVRAGRRVDNLLVGEKREARARELEDRYGVAVVGTVTILVLIFLLANLVVDILYGVLDPRISND